VNEKVVDAATAKAFADSMRIPFIETSAKASTNVEQCFISMARDIKGRLSEGQPDASKGDGGKVALSKKTEKKKTTKCLV